MIKQNIIRKSKKKSVIDFFLNQHNDIVMNNTEQGSFATKQHTSKCCYFCSLQWCFQEIHIPDFYFAFISFAHFWESCENCFKCVYSILNSISILKSNLNI